MKLRLPAILALTSFLGLAYYFIGQVFQADIQVKNAETNLKFEINRELFPYKSHFLTLKNGARIHYIDEGKGPTLLLLHGNPTWSFLYRDIIAALKDDFRLVVPDYPGFGLSQAPQDYTFTPFEQAQAISELVQELDLQDMAIMVQDWGGPIGFDVALKNPQRVSRLIIGNTFAWPLERMGQKTFSMIMGGWPGQLASWCCNGVVQFFMHRGVVNKITKEELAMYLAPFKEKHQRIPTHIFPAQLLDAKPYLSNLHKQLDALSDLPVLIVWGLEDFAFQKPERTRFESLFPKHKTVLLKNAGHFIQEDAPNEIAVAIREFYQ